MGTNFSFDKTAIGFLKITINSEIVPITLMDINLQQQRPMIFAIFGVSLTSTINVAQLTTRRILLLINKTAKQRSQSLFIL